MKGFSIKSIILVVGLIYLSACTSSNPTLLSEEKSITTKTEAFVLADEKAKITALYKTWNHAVETGSRKEYLSILDENIRMVPPGAADIVGKSAYAEFLIPVFANAQYKIIHMNIPEIDFLSPNFALARYDYIVEVTMNGDVEIITDSAAALDQLSNNTKYHDVLKRQADGSWLVLRHMWNDGYLTK